MNDDNEYVKHGDISIERIRLEIRRLSMSMEVPDLSRTGIDIRLIEEQVARRLIIQLHTKIAYRKYDVKTVSFPNGPWQFLKFNTMRSRWYGFRVVRWFINRFPVQYNEVTMEANAYHPDIAIPDHVSFVEILHHARVSGIQY